MMTEEGAQAAAHLLIRLVRGNLGGMSFVLFCKVIYIYIMVVGDRSNL